VLQQVSWSSDRYFTTFPTLVYCIQAEKQLPLSLTAPVSALPRWAECKTLPFTQHEATSYSYGMTQQGVLRSSVVLMMVRKRLRTSCKDLLEVEQSLAAATKRARRRQSQTLPWESGSSNELSSWCQTWQMAKVEQGLM
jgi:hypothetical protein